MRRRLIKESPFFANSTAHDGNGWDNKMPVFKINRGNTLMVMEMRKLWRILNYLLYSSSAGKNKEKEIKAIESIKTISRKQNCVVKMKYGTETKNHLRFLKEYLPQEKKEQVKEKPELFDNSDKPDIEKYKKEMVGRHYKFIISPENPEMDCKALAKTLVARLEVLTGHKFVWLAAVHTDTGHPHAHLLINGVDARGKKVECFRGTLLKHTIREMAKQICTEIKGERRIEDIKLRIEDDSKHCLEEMLQTINGILNDKYIPHEIKVRTKNIYGIYKRMEQGHKLSDIHDLLSLKIMVDTIANCYQTLGLIHSQYHPINDKFKDYIYNPKTNMYRSLHTTVFGEDDRLVQTQIRTFDMDKVASFGLTAYWDINKGEARNVMQKDIKDKYQFFKSLVEINSVFADNQEFVSQVKRELFTDKVYVYTPKGEIVELPKGSTAIDFAYKIHSNIGNTMVSAVVNEKAVEADYVLQNKDRVRIITDILSYGPREEWLDKVKTTKAKRKIREFREK